MTTVSAVMKISLPLFIIASLSSLTACGELECLDAVLAEPTRQERFAYIASDYTSSVLGVLDAEGELIGVPLISSGSTPPGALTALSGDVSLATKQPSDRILYVERLGTDLMTEVSRKAWLVEQQSRVSRLDGETFRANPQDMLAIGEDRYWVSRHNINTKATDAFRQGNDIAIIGRPGGAFLGTISLAAANTSVEGETIYARPGRMVYSSMNNDPASGIVVVGLARLSTDFQVTGPGAIALVHPLDETIQILLLNPLTNCGEVRPVLGEPSQVLVVCAGSTFVSPEERRATSGIALIDAQTQQVLRLWRAATNSELFPPQHGAISLGDQQVVVVGLSQGDFSTQIESQLLGIDLATGVTEVIAVSAGQELGFGAGAYDPSTNTLVVPDSNRTQTNPTTIRRFVRNDGLVFVEQLTPTFRGCDELAIREIALLSRPTDE